MRFKKLGKTDVMVSEITTGTWGLGGGGWGEFDKAASLKALNTMADLGVNMIDTAPVYGDGVSEEITGEFLKGKREKIIVSTKCGIDIDAPRGENRRKSTEEVIVRGCEGSLKRLDTDYIDVFFVHWPDPDTPLEITMGALNKLKEQGKIRYIGMSNFNVELLTECTKHGVVDVLQPPFSMVDQSAKDIMVWAHQQGISSVTYGSIGAGILSGQYRSLPELRERDVRGSFYGKLFKEPGFSKVQELLSAMDKIAEARKVPLTQIAINWVCQKEYVLTALIGVRTDAHAKENCAAMDWSLTQDEIKILDAEVERLFGSVD
ncbi:MAG: aldo/keto reductase [Treponema sp.]|nr:aldo/keto reductase [Treponema sp.]